MEWKNLSNTDLVAFAVYLLGGEGQLVHTEDIAVQAARLSPGRFSWQRHPDQIDISLVRRSLSIAKRDDNYVTGSAKTGWKLTKGGTNFVEAHKANLPGPVSVKSNLTEEERRFHPWQRRRIQAHPTFRKVLDGLGEEVTKAEAEAFFLFDRTMSARERAGRLNFLVRSFEYDPVIGPIVSFLAQRMRQEQTDRRARPGRIHPDRSLRPVENQKI